MTTCPHLGQPRLVAQSAGDTLSRPAHRPTHLLHAVWRIRQQMPAMVRGLRNGGGHTKLLGIEDPTRHRVVVDGLEDGLEDFHLRGSSLNLMACYPITPNQ